jgi:SAM-dependent methyltransferase
MKENSKSIFRRLTDSNYVRRYFVGDGVDIGGKPDPLILYREFFPQMGNVRTWDMDDGDAQYMHSVADEHFDFVYSSHCLEHLNDPCEGIRNWFRILKPGGHMLISIPEEDLYEQGVWPSTHNVAHRHSFTLYKQASWSEASINILELLQTLGAFADIRKIEVLDQTYRYDLPRFDQTLTPVGECGIELVIRKRTSEEIELGGRLPRDKIQPIPEHRVYYNQYRLDQQSLKNFSKLNPIFEYKEEL